MAAENRGNIFAELWVSSEMIMANKISILLIAGPLALLGDGLGFLGDAPVFTLAGIALIPCAERLSYVTEQVAEHTNQTIGALLNATFGNAPELLISTAALRAGYYRVVQLAMLGSMLSNMLFVFGLGCLVGGLRWQVQELRITSGNVNVGLLLLSVAGSLLPGALILGGQIQGESNSDENIPSREELRFCRVNAFVMIFMYGCFLVFQLGTHKSEFEDDDNTVETPNGKQLTLEPHFSSLHGRQQTRRNMFCLALWSRMTSDEYAQPPEFGDVELMSKNHSSSRRARKSKNSQRSLRENDANSLSSNNSDDDSTANKLLPHNAAASSFGNGYFDDYDNAPSGSSRSNKPMLPLGLADPHEEPPVSPRTPSAPELSFRVGILWLFLITLGISALSDILVDTIHGFCSKFAISEVFTSMIIVPFFSNVAEQVSAVIFAYRNEMDLCVGVTVGSAIQVANFVLPGCVLIGMFIDRSMTLYFHAYETVCLFLAVVTVAAVLQGGTTNWLVGMTLIGIYMMIATGFWFHTIENLSVDEEDVINNSTSHLE